MSNLNILTFNAEDWYNGFMVPEDRDWDRFEYRVDKMMYPILDLLEEKSIKATFFCLGWLSKKHPQIIKEIFRRGHSIGCNGYWHVSPKLLGKDNFLNDTKLAKNSIEDVIGSGVKIFRAPNFAIDGCQSWFFDTLLELGFQADSSAFANQTFNINGIAEFPISKIGPISFIGGGYFRLMPYGIIKQIGKHKNYMMTYFHPRDFDKNQPRWKDLSAKDKLSSYVGLNSAFYKLTELLDDFVFTDIENAMNTLGYKKDQTL